MINIIYPKGSIIGKVNDEKKYCIVDIKKDGYNVINYPFGVLFMNEETFINFNEVGKLYFWGYMGVEYTEELKKKYKNIIMGDSNE